MNNDKNTISNIIENNTSILSLGNPLSLPATKVMYNVKNIDVNNINIINNIVLFI